MDFCSSKEFLNEIKKYDEGERTRWRFVKSVSHKKKLSFFQVIPWK